jgi:hypothetical protein
MKKKPNKVVDFLIGFFAMAVVAGVVKNGILLLVMEKSERMAMIFAIAALVFLYALSIAYFYDKRRYIANGIIAQMIINAVFIGITAYIMLRQTGAMPA